MTALRKVTLKDKYELEEGVAFMSGLQALARIPIVQRQRDIAAGLNTAGFISGYRGSPLGGYDRELERAQKYLDHYDIKFLPGVNEDLAATMVWGTQQVNLYPGGQKDGVFGIWYGKSPGVDRSGDVLRHANATGTAPLGGVLAIAGDDHGCKSSTLPCQSDHLFYAYQIPMLYPASIQEFVEYGLLGIAMSRYSGCWTAMKVTSETVETSGTVDLSREKRLILNPEPHEFEMPPGGIHIRLNDLPREIDWRLQNYKLFACHAFARKNNIDRVIFDSPKPRFGIITSGKSYGDVRQALHDLGIDEKVAAEIGLRLYKVGMPWPLEPQGAHEFVAGLEEILIVEEKREFIENQLKQQIFNWPPEKRPIVVGKYDENGKILLPLENDHTVGMVARVIAQRLSRFYHTDKITAALRFYESYSESLKSYTTASQRKPYYCAGCPHNTSTAVPEGSRAMVGIGCHYMVQWMDRNSSGCTQMGGEGVPWAGQAPYTSEEHIFANLGDGTYFHSGTLAIRQAVAAKVNITYKILYNDAVAMTGGQHVDGDMPVSRVAQQCIAEGVNKCWILTESPEHYKDRRDIPSSVPILHRNWFRKVQEECKATPGTTVIIYDQTCAAEKRRRRKRGQYPDPAKRVFINKDVCEGCGDCSVQSNCVAVMPLETEFGRKRQINQSMCNKDYSCVKGFCPSFVTIHGGSLRKNAPAESGTAIPTLPDPQIPALHDAWNIMVTGVGGTGVLTIGALLGMAAHLERKHSAVLDMTGLAQKGGEVLSHVRIAAAEEDLHIGRINSGSADLLLACDIVSATGYTAYETLNRERTHAIINEDNMPVAAFVLNNKIDFHQKQLRQSLEKSTKHQDFIEATSITGTLLGDEMGTNIFMMGYAWQKGQIPLSFASIERAIELNGVAIEDNKKAFYYGRLAAHDPAALKKNIDSAPGTAEPEPIAQTLDDIIAKRATHLSAYQNKSYAQRYQALISRVREKAGDDMALAVAKNYHRLLAYKDEYEVARLFTNGDFMRDLKAQFEGDYKLHFHMAPPIFEQKDPATGRPKKREFGPWMMAALRALALFKVLRGTPLDPFGRLKDRRDERALIGEYEAMVDFALDHLSDSNAALCLQFLSLPEDIRGYGPVKETSLRRFTVRKAQIQDQIAKNALETHKNAA